MRISVSEAKAQLTELVRRAEAGEEVVLTRHEQEVARIIPSKKVVDRAERRRIIEEISKAAAAEATPGPCAARSQDFLYDEFGVPR
ncbi:type II toxin-antitoxin system Phd/YefM family antitoxin [Dongia sp.]|uniref:type II toxin-antitoxin system Phd/YefM family antitoxin n=1 Tax=Dongia sp. TaxID=1977262 RepID=UPI0037509147